MPDNRPQLGHAKLFQEPGHKFCVITDIPGAGGRLRATESGQIDTQDPIFPG